MIIVTFAMGIILQYVIVARWGEDFYSYRGLSPASFNWGSVGLSYEQLTVVIVSIVLLGGFHLFVRHARTGRAFRAMADDSGSRRFERSRTLAQVRLPFARWLKAGSCYKEGKSITFVGTKGSMFLNRSNVVTLSDEAVGFDNTGLLLVTNQLPISALAPYSSGL